VLAHAPTLPRGPDTREGCHAVVTKIIGQVNDLERPSVLVGGEVLVGELAHAALADVSQRPGDVGEVLGGVAQASSRGITTTGRRMTLPRSVTSTSNSASPDFTDTFLETFASKDFTAGERKATRKALRLLDSDERHPSLRVHQLQGDLTGLWSASASEVLRLTFTRAPQGRKTLVSCSRHYDR
jgi:mRNA-degrading endonuclease YafQ of YafQ-DinJ toxin-antitoxin module